MRTEQTAGDCIMKVCLLLVTPACRIRFIFTRCMSESFTGGAYLNMRALYVYVQTVLLAFGASAVNSFVATVIQLLPAIKYLEIVSLAAKTAGWRRNVLSVLMVDMDLAVNSSAASVSWGIHVIKLMECAYRDVTQVGVEPHVTPVKTILLIE